MIASKVIAYAELAQIVVEPPPGVAGSAFVPSTETATSTAWLTVTVAVPVPVPAIPPVIDEIEYVDVALGLTDILKGLVPVAV